MDVDAEAINSGQGRCCHKIINDKKEQKMNNGNNNCGGRGSPVNVMDLNDEEDLSNEIADKLMSMLIQQLSISEVPPDSHQSCGGKVLDILRSKLNLLNTSGVEHSNKSKKRQRTDNLFEDNIDNAEMSLEGAGLGGGDNICTGGCDMSYTDTDAVDMAVDEESEESDEDYNTAENNVMLQEELGDVVIKDELNSSLATFTGKLCTIHTDV